MTFAALVSFVIVLIRNCSSNNHSQRCFLIVCYSVFFTLEKTKKGRKRKAVHAFFRRLRKTVKHLFLCRDSTRTPVEVPSEMKSVDDDIPVEPEPEPVCLSRSEQVCAALQSSTSVQAADADQDAPVLMHVSDSSDSEISLDCGESSLPFDISAFFSTSHYFGCESDTLHFPWSDCLYLIYSGSESKG